MNFEIMLFKIIFSIFKEFYLTLQTMSLDDIERLASKKLNGTSVNNIANGHQPLT